MGGDGLAQAGNFLCHSGPVVAAVQYGEVLLTVVGRELPGGEGHVGESSRGRGRVRIGAVHPQWSDGGVNRRFLVSYSRSEDRGLPCWQGNHRLIRPRAACEDKGRRRSVCAGRQW